MKHGFAFGEHIKTEKIKKRKYDDGSPAPFRVREFLLPLVLIVAVVLLLFKLFSLQIINGSYYRALADSNRVRTHIISAPRGVLYDRNGRVLAQNVPGFRQIVKDPSEETGYKIVRISKEQALGLIAKGEKNVEVDSLRQYPFKDSIAHVVGYMGQISKEELDATAFSDYQMNDEVGKGGIEQTYEHKLHGKDGQQLIEVDAMGKKIRSLGQTDPTPGQDITLTIDSKIQQAAYAAASGVHKGVVIVSTPTGEILAMVSKPSYDPNLFTLDETYKPTGSYTSLEGVLLDNKNQPLLNRAISGIYPPGSTFKLVTAAAGLENKIIDGNYRVTDTGVLKIGEFSFANWYYTGHGKTDGDVNVVRAIARSNDIFFYKLAEKVRVDRLSAMAKEFGLGGRLGIDLIGEAGGLLPTEGWKKRALGENWYLGDTYHYGIGQGYLLTTPLQVNSWTEVIANGGTLYQPRLIKNAEPRTKNKEILSEKTIELIRKGMIESCSKGGVAWPLYDFKVKSEGLKVKLDGKNFMDAPASGSAKMTGVSVACKTGTAQHGGDETLPHAWITLFAPAYNPQVVVTVLSESSGEGSNMAAPVAKKVLEAYFKQE